MWSKLVVGFCALFIADQAVAVIGRCGNRHLPRDKDRKARNINLLCSSRTSHYVRTPAAWEPKAFEEWRNNEIRARSGEIKYRQRMQAIGHRLPLIEWKGSIPYVTTEVWDWTEWLYSQHPICGTEKKKETRQYTDKDGKTKTEVVEVEVVKSCWHDEDRSESRFCSNEEMTYEAAYERPDVKVWNPEIKEYYDILPNKYDLLPGEAEDVQISNSDGNRAVLTPGVAVGDAWNKYSSVRTIDGHGESAPCRFQTPYHLRVKVVTEGRSPKVGPNAFRMPVDKFGRDTEPLDWQITNDAEGKPVRTMPAEIKLMDASDAIISALSRHSREFNEEEEAERIEQGGGQSSSKEVHREIVAKSPFWKNTKVRVVLYKIRNWNRDIRVTEKMYTDGAVAAMNGNYRINLFGGGDQDMFRMAGPLIPEFWSKIFVGLEPGSNYQFLIAMYNEGVPFYAQDCTVYPKHWNCGFFSGKDNWYSKELNLDFSAAKNSPDMRGNLQQFQDFQRKGKIDKVKSLWNSIFG